MSQRPSTSDFLNLRSDWTDEERAISQSVRFRGRDPSPRHRGALPRGARGEFLPQMGAMGLLGMELSGRRRPPQRNRLRIALREMERVDSSLRSMMGSSRAW